MQAIQKQNHINLTAIRSISAAHLRSGMYWRDNGLALKINSVQPWNGHIAVGVNERNGGSTVYFGCDERVQVSWEVEP